MSHESPRVRVYALTAMAGAALFALAILVQPFYRHDRSFVDPYSAYAVGPYGYVQAFAFVALGGGSLALVAALRSRGHPAGTSGPSLLLGVWGVGVLIAAVFPIDQGPIPGSSAVHGLASMISFFAVVAALLGFSAEFRRDPRRRRLASFSSTVAAVTVTGFVAAAATQHSNLFGFAQRLFLTGVITWLMGTGFYLAREE